MVFSSFILLEGCKNNPSSLTGTWNFMSVNETIGGQTTSVNFQSATGSLSLSANFTFSVNGEITSQSVARSLGLSAYASTTATGGYSYSGGDNTITFDVTSWSGKGSQMGNASGTYMLSGDSLLINLNVGNAVYSVSLLRSQ